MKAHIVDALGRGRFRAGKGAVGVLAKTWRDLVKTMSIHHRNSGMAMVLVWLKSSFVSVRQRLLAWRYHAKINLYAHCECFALSCIQTTFIGR